VKSLIARLLVFFLGIPAIVALILFLPQYNQIGISLLICLFVGMGGIEVFMLFPSGERITGRILSFIIAFSVPLLEYLNGLGILPREAISIAAALFIILVMSSQVFSAAKDIPGILERVTALFMPLIYPGILGMFLVRIGAQPNGGHLYFLFFAATFSNDSAAWLFGMLLGKKRNIVAVSPNKSIPGFLGGMALSMIAPCAFALIAPELYPGAIWRYLLLGAAVGLAVVFGDLAESGLKRSAGKKDSGNAIPGRGGVLDSIDSLLFAAPVFLAMYRLLFAAA
jgi:phosphatidate cytidylyltransferase